MKFKKFLLFFLLIILCCYQYTEYKREPEPIDVPIPTFAEHQRQEITTERQMIRATITEENPTVSHAVANSIRNYLKQKGITGEFKIARETLYSIVNEIPNYFFRSKNKNRVFIGETFQFRMPQIIYIIREGLDNYYACCTRVLGMEKLQEALAIRWLKPYERNVFDCTERSAFLEYWLERNGFNTDIVCSPEHCWVIVEVEPGKLVHVEASSEEPQIIPDKNYNCRYKNIYEAQSHSPGEFDWWNSVKEGERIIGRK